MVDFFDCLSGSDKHEEARKENEWAQLHFPVLWRLEVAAGNSASFVTPSLNHHQVPSPSTNIDQELLSAPIDTCYTAIAPTTSYHHIANMHDHPNTPETPETTPTPTPEWPFSKTMQYPGAKAFFVGIPRPFHRHLRV